MALLFRNRYRVPSARWERWDYTRPGFYHVTICTEGQGCCLGEVRDGEVLLSPYGEAVAREWQRIPGRFPRVVPDAWVVMPDHFHAIVNLGVPGPGVRKASLGEIVGAFKSQTTKVVRSMGWREFAWQERFHDRILKDFRDLERVREYIRRNPLRWKPV